MIKIFKILLIILLLLRISTFSNNLPEGKMIELSGRIKKEVVYYDYYQRINILGHDLYIDKYPILEYGDFVVIRGEVLEGKIKNTQLLFIKEGTGIYAIRKKIISSIQKSLPTKDAALVSGVLLGSKKLITDDFSETLIDSGTIHVVVASGTNITLTAGFLISVLVLVFKRRVAIPLALAGVWAYVVLSGFDPPLIRAAIMGSIAFSAQLFGRVNDTLTALSSSAIVMLLINPLWLTDVGFQLSLVATLSLILFESHLYNRLSFVPSVVRQDLSTSLSAQIGVAPLLLYYFGRISAISPLINMLVLWTISPLMILAAIISVLSLVYEPMASLYVLLIPLTRSFISIVELF